MWKKMLILVIMVFLLFSLIGCKQYRPYDAEDFIGLTSAEIIEKYGKFDNIQAFLDENNLYYYGTCGYIVKESQAGFLGTTPPEYFLIYFDKDGIAYKCTYETGGWGG